MNKLIYLVVFICLFIFNNNISAVDISNLLNKAKQYVPTDKSTEDVNRNTNSIEEKPSSNKKNESAYNELSTVELNQGIYKIPLKASLSEVIKWCEENKVNIMNPTKQEIENKARNMLSQINAIKKAYDTDKAQLSEMEKEILKLSTDKEIDATEKYTKEEAKKVLIDLKNPPVEYGGESYLLTRKFKDGEIITIGAVETVCADSRITDMVYVLKIAPSLNSERLLNNGLSYIDIFFKKDNIDSMISYATIAFFLDPSKAVTEKQYNSVIKVLTDKYGNPSYCILRPDIDMSKGVAEYKITDAKENTPAWDIYHFSGNSSVNDAGNAIFWKKNIVLAPEWWEDGFYVIYYETNIVKNILDSYKQAVVDAINDANKETAKKELQNKEDF